MQDHPSAIPQHAGDSIKEFVDGVPVDRTTGRPIVQPPGATDQPAWVDQLKMPGQAGSAPEIASPVPSVGGDVPGPSPAERPPRTTPVPPPEISNIPLAPVVLTAPVTLPAVPSPLAQAPKKCITEGCNCKPKDRGMCVRCLKDTLAYMEKDPKVTWEFLEQHGLALPSRSASSGSKFCISLAAKLTALHTAAGQGN